MIEKIVSTVIILSVAAMASNAQAEATHWMSAAELREFVKTSASGMWYPTKIECKDVAGRAVIRLTTVTFDRSSKPFHKWNYVIGRASELSSKVERLKRSDRFDLKYKMTQITEYTDTNGIRYGCAVAFR